MGRQPRLLPARKWLGHSDRITLPDQSVPPSLTCPLASRYSHPGMPFSGVTLPTLSSPWKPPSVAVTFTFCNHSSHFRNFSTHTNISPHTALYGYLAVSCVSFLSLHFSEGSSNQGLCMVFHQSPFPPPQSLHGAGHVKGIQWVLAYSDPIIVGKLLTDLCMNKFSIFNFLFVCVTQWRSIVLNCIQNFCLLSISCRPKKKKKRLLASGKHFL